MDFTNEEKQCTVVIAIMLTLALFAILFIGNSILATESQAESIVKCDVTHTPAADGRGGFLSKQSDAAHHLAWTVLFPHKLNSNKKYFNPYSKVETHDSKGNRFFTWTYSYLYSEDKSYRPVYRANHEPSKAPKNVILRALDNKNKWNCWAIPDPTQRVD